MRRAIPKLPLLMSSLLTAAAIANLALEAKHTSVASISSAYAQVKAHDRIVAVGGAITEILYAIGLQDEIVGVDTTSVHPPEAMRDKPSVGYVRALSAEGVLSLNPSLVIAIDGAGPPDAVKLLDASGVRIAHIPDAFSAEGVVDRIRKVAALTNARDLGDKLAADVAVGFAKVEEARARIEKPKRVLFILSLLNGKVMASGRNTSAEAMIRLAGGVNALDAFEGYKPVNDEAITAAQPDFVLVMSRGDHALTAEQVFALPAFATTPAARAGGFASKDGQYLLGFGPRTPDAALELMRAIYGVAATGKS